MKNLVIIWLVLVNSASLENSALTQEPSRPAEWIFSDPEQKFLIWSLDDSRYAIIKPFTLEVATKINSNSPIIGFVHSGYTGADPDGKNAILNISIQNQKTSLRDEEKKELEDNGLIFNQNVKLSFVGEWELDVELPLDSIEADRIRMKLQFPKKISAQGLVLPVQIAWKDVNGSTLYEWITDKQGLQFVTRIPAKITWKMEFVPTLDQDKLNKWWNKYAGESEILQWHGGISPLILSLVSENCLKNSSLPEEAIKVNEIVTFYPVLSNKIRNIIRDLENNIQELSRSDLFNLNLNFRKEIILTGEVIVKSILRPGLILNSHPELVKDLTSNKSGLEVIKENAN